MRFLAGVILAALLLVPSASGCTGTNGPPSGDHYVFQVVEDGQVIAELDSFVDPRPGAVPRCASAAGPISYHDRHNEPPEAWFDGSYLLWEDRLLDIDRMAVWTDIPTGAQVAGDVLYWPLWPEARVLARLDLAEGIHRNLTEPTFAPSGQHKSVFLWQSSHYTEGIIAAYDAGSGRWLQPPVSPLELGLPDPAPTLEAASDRWLVFQDWNEPEGGTRVWIYDRLDGTLAQALQFGTWGWQREREEVVALVDDELFLVRAWEGGESGVPWGPWSVMLPYGNETSTKSPPDAGTRNRTLEVVVRDPDNWAAPAWPTRSVHDAPAAPLPLEARSENTGTGAGSVDGRGASWLAVAGLMLVAVLFMRRRVA